MVTCKALVRSVPGSLSLVHLPLGGGDWGCRTGAGLARLVWFHIRSQALHTCQGDDERTREHGYISAYNRKNKNLNGRFDG